MAQAKPGPIRRVLVGTWNLIDFTRRLVFNLIFLLLLALLLVFMFTRSGVKPLADRSALVLDLSAALVEQYGAHPVDRVLNQAMGRGRPEVQLRDVLAAIEAAKDDKRIERIVINTEGFSSAGYAAIRDVAAALREFRASGKQVVAWGSEMDQKQYYLAAQADEVYLDPMGMVFLEGLARYRLYYREGLQDKLGVDVHLFKVGEYKSAAEPYVLDAASPEAREADLFWMSDIWQRFLADIAQARKLEVAQLQGLVEDLPARVQAAEGDLAALALQAGLVDGLKTAAEFEQMMIERGALDEEEHSFRQVALRPYLAQQTAKKLVDSRPQVAVVVAQGEITYGQQAPGTVGGDSTSDLLRQAREDENVKAVVLRVDSPGGAVYPSEQIRREVELTKAAGKPVVVSMGNVAASGGYWISMNADRIYADENTITGSIGIFGLWMSVPRVMDKLGINTDGVGTTPLAGAFDPTRPLDPGVGRIIQAVIDKGYRDFTGKVAAARGSTPEQIDVHARGRVWTGAQARERGLVDELGGLEAALAEAARRANLEEGKYGVSYVERPLSPLEQFIVNMGGSAHGQAMLRWLAPAAPLMLDGQTLKRVERGLAWLDRDGRTPFQAVAHCFCDY
ncbi:signal peptide peptidase SppA [Arenimonas fontis]|uniref:Signal peptide peptidase SppA n=1 Tax=Arenimonas fontis TaxID=2608255 RepID=A0A5B2ZBX4_9GAMM|nr:signal peptide peptidase SppA [Arenimonas fontis]KAA2284642.1 signal peptide peptidase SppA [Arenimonas fontis]